MWVVGSGDLEVLDSCEWIYQASGSAMPRPEILWFTDKNDSFNLTKLDILDGLKELQVAIAYDVDGQRIESFPGMFHMSQRS